MDYDHDNVRLAVTEDRLSRLPDELIHQILSCLDTKYAVQTCLLSSRWKLLWTSVPCLNFTSCGFKYLPKFAKFVTNVLSRRNHQVEVSLVKLTFNGAASQFFVRKIANYAFSHNVQELTVFCSPKNNHEFPSCLFSSRSLKHLTIRSNFFAPCVTPKTPWDFPALTTLHLSKIRLCDTNTGESVDLFSKCVNLKSLVLNDFIVFDVNVFDIIAPRLSSLVLIDGQCCKVINVIAPQLENLTITDCSIKYLNAPPVLSSFCCRGYYPPLLPNCRFHSLNKVNLHFYFSSLNTPYNKEEYARETINMLQQLHSARFLTLNLDIVECLSSFPDLLSHLPSPFRNLVSLNIDSSREEPYKVKISTEVRNFLLENSPNATFITDLPEEPPTKAMLAKLAREKKKAKLVADIESHMKKLQALLENENALLVERKQAIEKTRIARESLVVELKQANFMDIMMRNEPEQTKKAVELLDQGVKRITQMLYPSFQQEYDHVLSLNSKKAQVRLLLEKLPKRQRAEIEARYSCQLDETNSTFPNVSSYVEKITNDIRKNVSDNTSTCQDVSRSKLHLVSQPSSSCSSSATGR